MPPNVPKHAQIPPGTPVNIVLKPDQRTGKLTTGVVADLLTRGDHPRGVKVRLGDGRVGRVQSIAAAHAAAPGVGGTVWGGIGPVGRGDGGVGEGGAMPIGGGGGSGVGRGEFGVGGGESMDSGRGAWKIQDDYRNDPVPVEKRSLEDYVKVPSKNQRKKGRKDGGAGATDVAPSGLGKGSGDGLEEGGMGWRSEDRRVLGVQEQLEGEFSKLDSALIAAVVADHGDVEGAREVLRGLS